MGKAQEREVYSQAFEALLEKLNKEQLQAVRTIEGPVLAIAGPGTGKTHILSARIGEILLKSDTQAQNILCLTFTDAGVQAMRQRLLHFIGPEAYRVPIYTFHSFCNRIIQEHSELFGRQELHALSELERMDMIRLLLGELDEEHIFRKQQVDPYFYEKHLQDFLRRMKSEAWSIQHIENCVEEQKALWLDEPDLRYQRNGKGYKTGELKPKYYDLLERMDLVLAAAKLFEPYQELLYKRHAYDYEDMLLWVLQAFDEQDWLLRMYQEQFLYVLVDEFQDTNGAQYHLVERLVEYWGENPNIFIVGDDDQSIFEFQGARLEHIKNFYESYKSNIEIVLLRQNYRSAQEILDYAHGLIESNEMRLVRHLLASGIELSKKLSAANAEVAEKKPALRALVYPNPLQELLGLIDNIDELLAQGVEPNEIAVLYAKHRQARLLSELLDKQGRSYKVRRQLNILQQPLVSQLRKLWYYISEEALLPNSQEGLLAELIHYPCFGLSAGDIRELLLWRAEEPWQARRSWRKLLASKEEVQKRDFEKPEAVLAFSEFLQEAEQKLYALSLPEFLEYSLLRSGMLAYILHGPESDWNTQVVYSLFQFLREESYRQQELSLGQALSTLERMSSSEIPLELYRSTEHEQGINLLTVHSAKGLEFRHVFIIQCSEKNWESRNSRRPNQFLLPEALSNSSELDLQEADRRLFYVALTRGKESVNLSLAKENEQGKAENSSLFWNQLLEQGLEPEERYVAAEKVLAYQKNALEQVLIPATWRLSRGAAEKLLEGFQLSASALLSYKKCPLSFYFEYMLRLPSSASHAASIGTAWHNCLKKISDQAKLQGQYPAVEEATSWLGRELERQRPNLPQSRYRHIREQEARRFTRYYSQRRASWQEALDAGENIEAEKAFKQVELDGIPLVGYIDKIELDKEGRIRLIDYKTGKIEKKDLKAKTGKYSLQLLFYDALLRASRLYAGKRLERAAIDYLSEDEQGKFPLAWIDISEEERLFMRELIGESYRNIRALRFEPGCNKPHCKWCKLAKKHPDLGREESMRNELIESLDDGKTR